MKLLVSFAQFLISEWIWSFTFAFYHPIITVLMMILLLVKYAKQRIISAVFYAICSQIYASLIFTILIHVFFDMLLGISFDGYELKNMIHPLASCFLLGIIYSGFQISFFAIIRTWYRFPIKRFALVTCISNTIAALLVFKFLPVF
jgi:hypothetical protein